MPSHSIFRPSSSVNNLSRLQVALVLLSFFCATTRTLSADVVTPLIWELQIISTENFVALQSGTGKIDASLGPDGHVTALTAMGSNGGAGRYALLKAPGHPAEILLREGDSLSHAGLDDSVRKIDYVEAGIGGRAMVVADSLGDGRIGYRLVLDGGVGGVALVAISGQEYQGTTLRLHAGHMARLNAAGQLAFTGCIRADADDCRAHFWLNSLTPATGLQLTGLPLPGVPGQPAVASTWSGNGFPFNDRGQALIEVLLNDPQDGPKALVLTDGQTIQPIAVEGLQAPGLPAGEVYFGLFYSKELTENGWIALMCRLAGGGIGANETVRCLLAGQGGNLELIARTGSEIPGRPGYFWAQPSYPRINPDGTVIFRAFSYNPDTGDFFTELWQWRAGQFTSLARGRELIGGRGDTDAVSIRDPILSPTGAIFYSVIPDPANDDIKEIWMFDPDLGTSTPVVAAGTQFSLPDGMAGVLIGASLVSDRDAMERPHFDRQGRFLADLLINVNRDANNVNLDCVALIDPGALRPTAPVTVRLHRVTSVTPANMVLGRTDPDALVIPTPYTSQLATQPEVRKGLVADGVTPLLLSFEVTTAIDERFTSFGLKAEVISGGEVVLDGQPQPDLTSRLHWLDTSQNFDEGTWFSLQDPANNQNALPTSGTGARGYAYLEAIASDALQFSNGSVEIEVEIRLYAVNAPDQVVGRRTLLLRKPPVTLVHGYNTDGGWGPDFKRIIGQSRAWDEDNDADNFVRTVTYGQHKPVGAPGSISTQFRQLLASVWYGLSPVGAQVVDEYAINHENTLLPLAQLVPMLHVALIQNLIGLQANWAFTRHDVIAHSQGGLLIRMLSSERSFHSSYPAYQSSENFFRGRFHRVVTIGSPHNGSRLLAYVLMLDRNSIFSKLTKNNVAILAVFSGLAQTKFDPFGEQIVNLNTSPQWHPDPDAKFHLVRTTIIQGKSPALKDGTKESWLLQITDEVGAVVIPRGYDGVVDSDSMGGVGDAQSTSTNVFTLPSHNIVSHSGPEDYFSDQYHGPMAVAQTASKLVASHSIGALDQSNDAQFGRFVVPQLLGEPLRSRMRKLAEDARPIVDRIATRLLSGEEELVLRASAVESDGEHTVFEYALDPADRMPDTPVYWALENYGVPGAPDDGATLTVLDPTSGTAEVRVAKSHLGDVLLGAYYHDTDGALLPVRTTLVTSHEPEADLEEMAVMPGAGNLPVGSDFVPRFYLLYADDQVLTRYVATGDFSVESSNSAVVDVSDPGYWRTVGPGTAKVTTSYRGMTSVAEFTVYAPTNGLPDGPPPTDTDGDGAADLLEEAFGSNPAVPDPPEQPRVVLGSHQGQMAPLLEIPVFADGHDEGNGVYAARDFFYVIETSEDLRSWRSADSSIVYLPPVSDGPNRDLVSALIGSTSTRFLRVLVLKGE